MYMLCLVVDVGCRCGAVCGLLETSVLVGFAGWANIYMDAYARKGLIGSKFLPEEYTPSQMLLSYISA